MANFSLLPRVAARRDQPIMLCSVFRELFQTVRSLHPKSCGLVHRSQHKQQWPMPCVRAATSGDTGKKDVRSHIKHIGVHFLKGDPALGSPLWVLTIGELCCCIFSLCLVLSLYSSDCCFVSTLDEVKDQVALSSYLQ